MRMQHVRTRAQPPAHPTTYASAVIVTCATEPALLLPRVLCTELHGHAGHVGTATVVLFAVGSCGKAGQSAGQALCCAVLCAVCCVLRVTVESAHKCSQLLGLERICKTKAQHQTGKHDGSC